MLADERDEIEEKMERERRNRTRESSLLSPSTAERMHWGVRSPSLILGFMSIWSVDRNRFDVLYLATRVNNVSYERYVIFVT